MIWRHSRRGKFARKNGERKSVSWGLCFVVSRDDTCVQKTGSSLWTISWPLWGHRVSSQDSPGFQCKFRGSTVSVLDSAAVEWTNTRYRSAWLDGRSFLLFRLNQHFQLRCNSFYRKPILFPLESVSTLNEICSWYSAVNNLQNILCHCHMILCRHTVEIFTYCRQLSW
jgi:hypothetical protein